MQAGHHIGVLLVNAHKGPNNDKDLDGGPTDDEGRHYHQYHAGDSAQVAVLLFGAGEEADTFQAQNHESVADSDDQNRYQECKDENTNLGDCIPVNLRFWKLEETHHNATFRSGDSHDHDGHSNDRGEDPDADIDDLGFRWSTEIQSLDWMADGYIAVHTHHGEGEDAGEHVIVVNGEDNLAEHFPKRPGLH